LKIKSGERNIFFGNNEGLKFGPIRTLNSSCSPWFLEQVRAVLKFHHDAAKSKKREMKGKRKKRREKGGN
jgi:hypothetical protein